ncbi:MAG: 2-amino-4-hydroxy-6-hydroxymethyldihydropteridine diphosphokinase [Flavobacteriales bacterium]|nr:2-amino-4-hydroxy-6-hydroxymethyldihydropteridine diphosphokinase [Flavobacteriales bacterium]
MKEVFLIIGGNQGDVRKTFDDVKLELENRVGNIVKPSSIYSTVSWGDDSQPDYLNQVLKIESELSPREVLKQCLEIEKLYGRIRDKENQWASRTIDIDILYCSSDIVDEADLTIPHPRMHGRNFVLIPLVEIAPDGIHPVLKKTNSQLLSDCQDKLEVNAL